MRSSDWLPMDTAPLNPYGKAYGPAVLLWCSNSDVPVAAYYEPSGGTYDNKPKWTTCEEGAEIFPEDAVAWMPIAAPWSVLNKKTAATVKESVTVAELVMPAEIWCTFKKTWHFTDGYGTRYVRGDLAFRFQREEITTKPAELKGETLLGGVKEITQDHAHRMREWLLETSGRLHQLVSDERALKPSDAHLLAKDAARVANDE